MYLLPSILNYLRVKFPAIWMKLIVPAMQEGRGCRAGESAAGQHPPVATPALAYTTVVVRDGKCWFIRHNLLSLVIRKGDSRMLIKQKKKKKEDG